MSEDVRLLSYRGTTWHQALTDRLRALESQAGRRLRIGQAHAAQEGHDATVQAARQRLNKRRFQRDLGAPPEVHASRDGPQHSRRGSGSVDSSVRRSTR